MCRKIKPSFVLVLFVSLLSLLIVIPGRSEPMGTAEESSGPIYSSVPIANESYNTSHPSVAFDSQHQEYLVIWQSDPPEEQHIYAERVSPSNMLLGKYTVSAPGAGTRRYPDLAYNSQQDSFLVVWETYDGSYFNIRARIYHPNGSIGNEFYLGSGPALRNRYNPAVAYASTSDKFLVVWESKVVGGLSSDIVSAGDIRALPQFM